MAHLWMTSLFLGYEYNGTGNFEDFGPSAMGEWDDEIRATKLEHRHQCDDEIDVYDEGSKLLKCGLRKFRKHFEHCYPAFKKNESYSFYRSCDNKIPAQKDDKNSPEFIERHEKSFGDGRSGPVTRSSGENYENGTPQKLTEDDDPQKSTEDDTPPKLTEDPGVAASTKNPQKGGRSLETDGINDCRIMGII
ncbi:Hypothetical protein NTJ_08027 [Nesidiocoris tenuis]|uniref:Uncharacterized protein n=2 Tax=Nesidiocoris tenuis TaxID=355587 RepID=A0ABN7ASM7_9HEMI|nr:Hypothetical protein NTJ_08027 [Nesidiocoris tenuis]